MSLTPYQQNSVAASGTTVGAIFSKPALRTLSIPTISGSAGQRISNFTMIPSPEELEEREWNRLLVTPESHAFLDMLEEEALREYREGRTEEDGFGRD